MGMRRIGRELIFQTLYAIEYTRADIPDIALESLSTEKLQEIASDKQIKDNGKVYEFAFDILSHLLPVLAEIDEKIDKYSINWKIKYIVPLDKSILRLGVYELLFTETAPAIVINEAIEIAKKFSSESSGKFINGILNAVSEEKYGQKNKL